LSLFDFDAEQRWLFVFAHPDDEITVAATLRRLVQQGAAMRLLWLHSTPVRRAESLEAVALLGIPPADCQFLAFADGSFTKDLPNLISAIAKEAGSFGPGAIVTHAYENGHLDHDATSFAVSMAATCPVLEFPEYWPYTPRIRAIHRFADPTGEHVSALSHEEQRLKREMLKLYRTQTISRMLPLFELAARLAGRRPSFSGCERLRLTVAKNWLEPAVPARYAAQVLRSREWRTWVEAVARFVGEASSGTILTEPIPPQPVEGSVLP
jgi:LmbE family N-acetylglucosaminyl deacetylase